MVIPEKIELHVGSEQGTSLSHEQCSAYCHWWESVANEHLDFEKIYEKILCPGYSAITFGDSG